MGITGQGSNVSSVTIDQLLDALDSMPKDPIAEWMKAEGFDPGKGCKLVLPESMRGEMGPLPANYMVFSMLVSRLIMVNPNLVKPPEPRLYWGVEAGVTVKQPTAIAQYTGA